MRPEVPQPPHAVLRKEPLPSQLPKPEAVDPSAQSNQELILNSPSYRPAVEDVDFLKGYESRGIRLQLDYLKTERQLQSHGIDNSIVVFGSTRLVEPDEARLKVDQLQKALHLTPENGELRKRVSIAQRIHAKSHFYDIAREFSRIVGLAGEGPQDPRLVVVTGGGPGIMEAANRGAADTDAMSVGLNITLPQEQFPNPYVTPELCFQFHYFALRKLHFMLRARAFVAFPGGFGTLDELFETLTLIQTRKIKPLPVVLVGEAYWRRVFDIDFLVDEGVIDIEDRELFWYAETAEAIWEGLLCWYERKGESLIP